MGASDWAVLAVVTVAAALAGVFLALVGSRLFALLGKIVDTWRPTPERQARPGHENFGGGLFCLMAPAVVVAIVGPDTFSAVSWNNLVQWLWLVAVIVAPPVGVMQLLKWKNSRLEFDGSRIRRVDLLGRRESWREVISAKMTPRLYDEGRVGFEVAGGCITADPQWINIRLMYDGLRDVGVETEPWREPAHWRDLWR